MKIFGHTIDEDGIKRHIAVHMKTGRSVSLSRTHMITGTNRNSGKTYARWALESRIGFWRTDKGTICAFVKEGRNWRSPEVAFNQLETRQSDPFGINDGTTLKAEQLFVDNVREQFNINSYTDIYPIGKLKELRGFDYIPHNLVSESRSLDIMEFTRRVFGVRNYRKDLVRQVAGASMGAIAVAKEFRGLVPADWLVRFLANDNINGQTYNFNVSGLRDILRQIDPRSYRRILFRELVQNDTMLLQNLVQIYRGNVKQAKANGGVVTIANEVFSSFTELHDNLVGHRAYAPMYQAKPYENETIKLTSVAKRLHGTKADGYVIACAMETDDMLSWGKQMSNCIGTYHGSAKAGANTFGAIYQGDELFANFQVGDRGTLVQLLGRFNKNLPDDSRSEIEDILIASSVKIPGYYMGSPDPYHAPYEWIIPVADPIQFDVPNPFGFAALTEDLPLVSRTRINVGGGAYLAQGTDERGNEVPS